MMKSILPVKKSLLLLFFLLLNAPLFSQIDREFWFVGPEASVNHGDRPVYLRISTMDDPADILLRMPANPKFVPIQQIIGPNTTFSIRLDNIAGDNTWLDSIENRPPDQVLRKGLLLTSDNYVTAYYEINNASNPAIFPFKGKNGVGTEFYISGQTDYANQTNDGSEAFDIVATQDTTTITITPSIDIVGHPANVPFQIVLNKGQTYSARTLITIASASLAGSHVVADKPIAITISDDSIITGGWDIIGDQIIPINLLGKEYIVIKGYANNVPPANNDERVYIMAIQDGTEIRIDGNTSPSATINTGEQYDYDIPTATNTAYIKTNKPVYVYHLTGHPGEAGASILPQDSCTGSRSIGFNRSTTSAFALMILTRNGNQDFFALNGNNGIITGANFNVVPGTDDEWVYYRQNNLPASQVPVGANLLENTNGKFHLGILNNVGASSEYGYFSDFSTLYLGSNTNMCPGDSLILDGGPFMTSYEWKKLVSGVWTLVGTSRTYTVKDSGFYACQTNGDFCLLADTIRIDYYPNGTVSLGTDRTICEGTTTTFEPGIFVTYEWSTGATGTTLTTGDPGPLWVTVTNNNGCIARDTVMIFVDSLPLANHPITGPPAVCQGLVGATYAIDPLQYATSYTWTLPAGATGSSVTTTITVAYSTSAISGNLMVHGNNACGEGPDVVLPVTVDPLPGGAGLITGPPEVCQGQNGIVFSTTAITNASNYQWSLPPGFTIAGGGGTATVTVNVGLNASPGNITVNGSNPCGDGSGTSMPVVVNLFPQPAGPITGAGTICQGQTGVAYSILPVQGANSYLWSLPAGAVISSGAGTNSIIISFDSTAQSGILTVRGQSAGCGDGLPSSLALTVNPLPSPAGTITGLTTVCQAQGSVAYSVPAIPYATSYTWTFPPGCSLISGAGTNQVIVGFSTLAVSGIITVRGHNATCGEGRRSGLNVTVNPLPAAPENIMGPVTICQGEPNISYSVQSPDPSTVSYTWILTPLNAGIFSGATSPVGITWNDNFSGTAILRVYGQNGCGNGPESPQLSIQLDYKPNVSFLDCNDIATTKNARPIVLKGGLPRGPGEHYAGTGVSEIGPGTYVFDPGSPAVAGSAMGTPYNITYRYTNVNNCYREALKTIKVYLSNGSQPCPGIMTDVRDGRSYATFLAGSGTTARCWMSENLDYGTFIQGTVPQTDNCIIEKYCLNGQEAQCNISGGYYQWTELMNYTAAAGGQGICPPGWHVPTQQEWTDLENLYLGPGIAGSALKDRLIPSGFHALITGLHYLNNTWEFTAGNLTGVMFWSSSPSSIQGDIFSYGLNSINSSASLYPSATGNAFPVRCAKD